MKTLYTKIIILSLLSLMTTGLSFGQTTIAEQDFDAATSWNYSSDVTYFSHEGRNTNNNVYPLPDGWSGDGFYGIIDINDASGLDYVNLSSNILGERDLDDEGDFGTSGDATTTFTSIDVSSYTNVEVSFDYDIEGYNANEDDKATGENQVTVFDTYPYFYINSRLYLSSDLEDGNSERDAIGLRFSENFTTLGSDEDATKLGNPDENYAVVNNDLRSIDKQAMPIIGHEIDLSITNYTATDYSLTFVMENNPEDISVFLADEYLNTETELTDSFVYDFSVDSNIPESIAEDRFKLRFETGTFGTGQFDLQGISVYPNPADDVLNINLRENTGRFDSVELFDINGRLVAKQSLSNQMGETQLDVNTFSSGVYLLKVSSESEELSTKIIIK